MLYRGMYSPLLFKTYSEKLFREALEDSTDGLSINGEIVNKPWYADDTVGKYDTVGK